mgnify:CR=1 FL=1|tara:strand:- start:19121 stop:20017 length:897 start_codon:yes stop_codon:yes gene_type:complete
MQLDHSQLQRYSSYQLVLLANLSILSWVIIIISPNLFSMDIQLLLLLTTVTVIGIPHGYFDFLVAKKLYSNLSNWLLKFILIYLATSLVYLYVWTVSSIFALILFLLMALYHFAVEETMNLKSSNHILMLALGSVPILTPIIFHTDDVFSLFSILLSTKLHNPEISILHQYLYVLTVSIIVFTYARSLTLLYTLLFINFIFLPPLLSFILYFCFHHSLRHYLEALGDPKLFDKKIPLARYALLFLFLTIAFTLGAIFMLSTVAQVSLESAIIKYIFITLACLTLPHLLLNIIYESKFS